MRTLYAHLGFIKPTKETYEAGKRDYMDVLKIMESQLKKTPYLTGNNISIADISNIQSVRMALRLFID